MTEACTTGTWRPKAGHEHEFVAAWTVFADWAAGMPGAGTLRLTRDDADPGRFVSFGVWQSNEAMRAWKNSPDFRERMSRVQHHVDAFEPRELTVVATAAPGSILKHHVQADVDQGPLPTRLPPSSFLE